MDSKRFTYHLRVFLTKYHVETVLFTNDYYLAKQSFKSIKRHSPKLMPYLIYSPNDEISDVIYS